MTNKAFSKSIIDFIDLFVLTVGLSAIWVLLIHLDELMTSVFFVAGLVCLGKGIACIQNRLSGTQAHAEVAENNLQEPTERLSLVDDDTTEAQAIEAADALITALPIINSALSAMETALSDESADVVENTADVVDFEKNEPEEMVQPKFVELTEAEVRKLITGLSNKNRWLSFCKFLKQQSVPLERYSKLPSLDAKAQFIQGYSLSKDLIIEAKQYALA